MEDFIRVLQLVYYEIFDTREESILREKYFRSGIGRAFLKDKL